jgi:DNA-binding transcriptional LysR family regulator
MNRESLGDLLAFIAVARERSFTRAAAKMGVSQSALSHTIRALEARMGVRLLTRTTRSVLPTEAGERLIETVAPRLDEIEAEVAAVSEMGDKVAGTIRITAIDYAVDSLLWPRLTPLLGTYPELRIEISTDYRMVDIVADRFDIGIRWGDQVAQAMIAVRLAPDMRQTIVASSGGIYAWELQNGDRQMQARIDGQTVFNGAYQMLNAALSGCGLAFLPEDLTLPHLQAGRLQSVMADWCPMFPGLHAYYPSRRQSSRALGLVIEAIRLRA